MIINNGEPRMHNLTREPVTLTTNSNKNDDDTSCSVVVQTIYV